PDFPYAPQNLHGLQRSLHCMNSRSRTQLHIFHRRTCLRRWRMLRLAILGEFKDANEIANTLVTTSTTGSPVYLRDLVDIARAYQSPPRYLNFYTWRDAQGHWQRTRAITLAVQMRTREQIGQFGAAVDQTLAAVKQHLPDDLIIARTSDQPRQV